MNQKLMGPLSLSFVSNRTPSSKIVLKAQGMSVKNIVKVQKRITISENIFSTNEAVADNGHALMGLRNKRMSRILFSVSFKYAMGDAWGALVLSAMISLRECMGY
ncbi:hypothetical protein KM043_005913 [Ampulex compressa]|nr:hypothetical protein KM043_005913 [Ampulex compressa]